MWITARRLQWVGRLWNSEAGQAEVVEACRGWGVSRRSVSGAAECEGMLAGRSALMAASLVGGVCTRC